MTISEVAIELDAPLETLRQQGRRAQRRSSAGGCSYASATSSNGSYRHAPRPKRRSSLASTASSTANNSTYWDARTSSSSVWGPGGDEASIFGWDECKEEAIKWVENKVTKQVAKQSQIEQLIAKAGRFADAQRRDSLNKAASTVADRSLARYKSQLEAAKQSIEDLNELILDIGSSDQAIEYEDIAIEIIARADGVMMRRSSGQHSVAAYEDSSQRDASESFLNETCEL